MIPGIFGIDLGIPRRSVGVGRRSDLDQVQDVGRVGDDLLRRLREYLGKLNQLDLDDGESEQSFGAWSSRQPHGGEVRLDPQLVHLVDQHDDVVGQHLAENLVHLAREVLAPE